MREILNPESSKEAAVSLSRESLACLQHRPLEGVTLDHCQSPGGACSFNHGRPDEPLTCDQPWPRTLHWELLPLAQPSLHQRTFKLLAFLQEASVLRYLRLGQGQWFKAVVRCEPLHILRSKTDTQSSCRSLSYLKFVMMDGFINLD